MSKRMGKEALDIWFSTEVLPLEGLLTGFLWRRMKDSADVPDMRQEVYVRVYESASVQGLPANAVALVLTVARNLLIDRARRSRIVCMEYVADLERTEITSDLTATDRHLTARRELKALQAALAHLPTRCREVVMLRKIEQLSQRDVARRMGITEWTVERQLSKGIRLLAERLFQPEAECDLPGRAGAQLTSDTHHGR